MTYEEIKKRAEELSAKMLAKGMFRPKAQAMVKAHEEPTIYLEWDDKSTTYGKAYDCFSDATITQAFCKAEAFIESRPSPEQAKMEEFMKALAKAIDIGNENNIEVEFLNPLVAQMRLLSENAITHTKTAQ